jgi:hypothetical protein
MTQSPEREHNIPASSPAPQKIGVYERPDTSSYVGAFTATLTLLLISIIFIILLSMLIIFL